MSQTLIDVSAPVYSGMVYWPGDPDTSITRKLDMAKGSVRNLYHKLVCLPLKLPGEKGAPARMVPRALTR